MMTNKNPHIWCKGCRTVDAAERAILLVSEQIRLYSKNGKKIEVTHGPEIIRFLEDNNDPFPYKIYLEFNLI